MTSYRVVEYPADAPEAEGFSPRGAMAQLWRSRDHEIIVSGPAETGKTFACLHKLDALLWKYPGAQGVLARKVRDTIVTSCLQTYLRKVLPDPCPVSIYGGEKPQWFDYPNGSRLWIAGLDDPGKALSSERDFVYVNQAEEITLADWEVMLTRATGRAGNAPYTQVFGDCNPERPTHWILSRAAERKLTLLESRHEDNPTLYDEAGAITPQGTRTLEILDSLTGLRYARLRKGRWVQAEGVVYEEWDPAIHRIHHAELPGGAIPEHWPRLWAIDFGFTNPFCLLFCALDGDRRLYVYRQVYMTKRLVSAHAAAVAEIVKTDPGGWPPLGVIADPEDAEGRATFSAVLGIPTVGAHKTRGSVRAGIQAVQARLKKAGDGKPRLYVVHGGRYGLIERDAELVAAKKPTSLEDEFDGYTWHDRKAEEPIDRDNHALDPLRYLVQALDAPRVPTDQEERVLRG